jgi:hypothetical protein
MFFVRRWEGGVEVGVGCVSGGYPCTVNSLEAVKGGTNFDGGYSGNGDNGY